MVRGVSVVLITLLWGSAASVAQAEPQARYDDIIARLAATHGVPESFVHRVVKRESRYNPAVVHRRCYGLMQLKHATARSMGYQGPPGGLLNPEINLTYGVPYLANAYRLANGDPERALRLYSGGYYYLAKRMNMLGELRTASSPEIVPEPPGAKAEPEPPSNPLVQALSFLAGPAPTPTPAPALSDAGQ